LILHQRLQFLLAVDEDGLDLGLLVGGQVEFLRKVGELVVGVHSHGVAGVTWRWPGLTLILGESGGCPERKHAPER